MNQTLAPGTTANAAESLKDVRVGSIVVSREMHDPADASTLYFAPAIVASLTPDGVAGLHVFNANGGVQHDTNARYIAREPEWNTWCTLADFEAMHSDHSHRRLDVAHAYEGSFFPKVKVGSIVHYRLPSRLQGEISAGSGDSPIVVGVDVCPAIVRDITPDGRLTLTALTDRGPVGCGPCSFSRNDRGCWSEASGNGIGGIVLYRHPLKPGVNPYTAGVGELSPAVVGGATPTGQFNLTVFASDRTFCLASCGYSADEPGSWHRP